MQNALAIFPFSLPVPEGSAEPTVQPGSVTDIEFSLSLADRSEGGVDTAAVALDAIAAAGTVLPYWVTTLPSPFPVGGDGVSALIGGDSADGALATPLVTGSNPADQSSDTMHAAAWVADSEVQARAIPVGPVVSGPVGSGNDPDELAKAQNAAVAQPEAFDFSAEAPGVKDGGAMPHSGRDRATSAPDSGDAELSLGVHVLPVEAAEPFQAAATSERSGKQGDGDGAKQFQSARIAEMRQMDEGPAIKGVASIGPKERGPGDSAHVLPKGATETGVPWADVKKSAVPATDARGSTGLGPAAEWPEPTGSVPTGTSPAEAAVPGAASARQSLEWSEPQALPEDQPEAGAWDGSPAPRSEAEQLPAAEADTKHAEGVSLQPGGFWEGLYAALSEAPTKVNTGMGTTVSADVLSVLPLQTAGHFSERRQQDEGEGWVESGKAVAAPPTAPRAMAASALFQISARSDPVPPTLPISEILAGFDPASDDQEPSFGLPLMQGPQVSFVATASGSAAALPVQQVAAQITTALSQSADGATELALSPEELGHVRLRLEPDAANPDRLVVMISFERPETLDLFRRHAGELAEALRAAGYSGADIGFGQQGGGDAPDRREDFAGPGPSGQADSHTPDPVTPRQTAGTSLDLRL